MRGEPERQPGDVDDVEHRGPDPAESPHRRIRRVVDSVLADLDGEFDAMYSRTGRPSVPPEQLLKTMVLMALYSSTASGPSASG